VAADMIGDTHRHVPNEEAMHEYRQLLPIFISLARVLETDYRRIATYQRGLIQKEI